MPLFFGTGAFCVLDGAHHGREKREYEFIFLSSSYHISREFSDGGKGYIVSIEYFSFLAKKTDKQIQVIPVTADGLWCILSDFDIQ